MRHQTARVWYEQVNRRINQQKVLVFDNDNVKYDIILGTNFLSKTGIKLNYSEGNMEWFDCSIPLRPPGGLDSKKLMPWKTCFTSKLKTRSLMKIGLNALQQRFWMPRYEKTDVVEVMKGLTHLNAHQKADLLQVL